MFFVAVYQKLNTLNATKQQNDFRVRVIVQSNTANYERVTNDVDTRHASESVSLLQAV